MFFISSEKCLVPEQQNAISQVRIETADKMLRVTYSQEVPTKQCAQFLGEKTLAGSLVAAKNDGHLPLLIGGLNCPRHPANEVVVILVVVVTEVDTDVFEERPTISRHRLHAKPPPQVVDPRQVFPRSERQRLVLPTLWMLQPPVTQRLALGLAVIRFPDLYLPVAVPITDISKRCPRKSGSAHCQIFDLFDHDALAAPVAHDGVLRVHFEQLRINGKLLCPGDLPLCVFFRIGVLQNGF